MTALTGAALCGEAPAGVRAICAHKRGLDLIKFLKAADSYQHSDPAPHFIPSHCRKRNARGWVFQLGLYGAADQTGDLSVYRIYLNRLPRKKLLDLSLVRFHRRRYLIVGSSLYSERLARSVRGCGVLDAGYTTFVVAGRGKVGRAVARSLSAHGQVKLAPRTELPGLDLSGSVLVLATDANQPLELPAGAACAPIVVSVGNKTAPHDCEIDAARFDTVLTDNPSLYAARGFSTAAPATVLPAPLRPGSLVLLFQTETSEFTEACAYVMA